MTLRKKALFSMIAGILVIGFLEITLGLLALASPTVHDILSNKRVIGIPQVVPDARLSVRPNPAYPEHDVNGFRNLSVPAKVSIVAMGDSQTYGTGVKLEEAWPKQLEQNFGQSVYSMACGGYGPAHSLLLWDEAVAMNPEIVIEAFYAGNDLYDSFNIVYNLGQLAELKNDDPQIQEQLKPSKQKSAIGTSVSTWDAMRNPAPIDPNSLAPRELLSRYSNLYGLFRRVVLECRQRKRLTPDEEWVISQAAAKSKPAYLQEFNNDQFKTLLTCKHRMSALNLKKRQISEGLQISWKAMQQMHLRSDAKKIRFVVVMIPTKEMVFLHLCENPTPEQLLLAENEKLCWAKTKDFMTANGIEFVDALPALKDQFAAGTQPYRMNADGHPNAFGHQAIAQVVADALSTGTKAKEGPLAGRTARATQQNHKKL